MNLQELINRTPVPTPWSEGENIPWYDPGFSARMLKEHLNQKHDAASRRLEKIDQHVHWIHADLLEGKPTRVLDLCCGPGLYTSRLARLGHACTGIDYSPASIAYASAFAADLADQEDVHCFYQLEDIRQASYGEDFGLVMLIYGEFNQFTARDAGEILKRANTSLTPGGLLLLEPQKEAAVYARGKAIPTWYSSNGGLFSDKPHLCLVESFWDETSRTATERYLVIDAAHAHVARYAASTQAYPEDELFSLLEQAGFVQPRLLPSLCGGPDETQDEFFVLVAQKPIESE
jgi:SAM-dependent methyltransferase